MRIVQHTAASCPTSDCCLKRKENFYFTKLLVAKDSASPVRRRNPSCKPGDLKLSVLEKQNCKSRKRNQKKTKKDKNAHTQKQITRKKKEHKKSSSRERRKPMSTCTKTNKDSPLRTTPCRALEFTKQRTKESVDD
jgi:hypothetical protein